MIQGHVFERVWEFKSPPGQKNTDSFIAAGLDLSWALRLQNFDAMKLSRNIILALLVLGAFTACERITRSYAGTDEKAAKRSSPPYTVEAKLNPATKTQ